MKYLALAILALACTTSAAVAQQDTLYGPRGFLGGVRADAFEIIRYCQAKYPATGSRAFVPKQSADL
jgi:hypothetical protein